MSVFCSKNSEHRPKWGSFCGIGHIIPFFGRKKTRMQKFLPHFDLQNAFFLKQQVPQK